MSTPFDLKITTKAVIRNLVKKCKIQSSSNLNKNKDFMREEELSIKTVVSVILFYEIKWLIIA